VLKSIIPVKTKSVKSVSINLLLSTNDENSNYSEIHNGSEKDHLSPIKMRAINHGLGIPAEVLIQRPELQRELADI
jgi:hypothetical protein